MMTPDASASIEIHAPAGVVWRAIADTRRMQEWSPENTGVRAMGEGPMPVGARFSGANRNGAWRWSTTCVVVESVPGRAFAFDVTFLGMAVARWRYSITDGPDAVTVEEQWWDHRGWVMKALGIIGTGVADRRTHNEAGMRATLTALRSAMESPDGS